MCVFLAATLSWLPVLVALDHPDDDHLHAVCAADDSASAGDAAAAFLVPRPLIFRHDGQLLQLRVGEHAQMLLSHELGYECDVWTKVVIKKVWAEGYAVVTMCSECRDVVAPKVSASFSTAAFFAFTLLCPASPAQRLDAAHAP
jgi:hypothetical protein